MLIFFTFSGQTYDKCTSLDLKKRIELNVKFLSRKTEIVFSYKKYSYFYI